MPGLVSYNGLEQVGGLTLWNTEFWMSVLWKGV